MLQLLTVVGARPQFVKAAAVARAIADFVPPAGSTAERVQETILHTGQHYDARMSDVFFEELVIPAPLHNLGIGSGTHGAQTGEMMTGIEAVVLASKPDAILVYGDTNSTMAGALVGAKCHVPVIHVEAGLRSFNRSMPEEINRVVTDHVSTLLLCPSAVSVAHLASEGIVQGVELVGDVMYDILVATMATLGPENPVAESCGVHAGSDYAVVTVHRAENTDDPIRFEAIVEGLEQAASSRLELIWPVHPRVRERLSDRELSPRVHLTEPTTYRQMLALLREARVVATDSGGLQKEAMWAGVPCVTMRDQTEWVETVDSGWNRLVEPIADAISAALTIAVRPPGTQPTPYGRGDAAQRIVASIASCRWRRAI